MSRFRRVGENIQCTFPAAEYDLLIGLHAQLSGLVSNRDATDRRFQRLFPPQVLDAQHADKPQLDDSNVTWREQTLTTAEAWLHTATQHRGIFRLTVALDAVDAVLQLINDMRLMLGASIDIDAFDRDNLEESDERQYALAVIDHLAWWQEELLQLLTDDDIYDEPR